MRRRCAATRKHGTSHREDMTLPPRDMELLTIRRIVPLRDGYHPNEKEMDRWKEKTEKGELRGLVRAGIRVYADGYSQRRRGVEEDVHGLGDANAVCVLDQPQDDEWGAAAAEQRG